MAKFCPNCFSETIMCSKLIIGTAISWRYKCIMLRYDLDLTFDLDAAVLIFKILSVLDFGNCKVQPVDTWKGQLLGGVSV